MKLCIGVTKGVMAHPLHLPFALSSAKPSLLAMCAAQAHILDAMSVTAKVRKSAKAKGRRSLIRNKTKARKAERLVARVSREDKLIIEEAASMNGQSVASFVVIQARRAASSALDDYRRIRLNAERTRNFARALNSPAPPIPAELSRNMNRLREVVSA